MRITTSYWGARLPDEYIKIGISRGAPRGGAAGYRMMSELAPGPWFNSVSPAEYLQRYEAEVLDRLDPSRVVERINELSGDRTPALCCFESTASIAKGDAWCHRSIVSQWLEDHLRIEVDEIGAPPEFNRWALLEREGIEPPTWR